MTLIKDIIQYILEPLKKIFNLSIQTNTFPDNMKIAIIKPLYTTNDKQQISNYMPISLLPQISKIFEKIFLIDYQNIYLSIILLTKINMVLFPDQIQPYHY